MLMMHYIGVHSAQVHLKMMGLSLDFSCPTDLPFSAAPYNSSFNSGWNFLRRRSSSVKGKYTWGSAPGETMLNLGSNTSIPCTHAVDAWFLRDVIKQFQNNGLFSNSAACSQTHWLAHILTCSNLYCIWVYESFNCAGRLRCMPHWHINILRWLCGRLAAVLTVTIIQRMWIDQSICVLMCCDARRVDMANHCSVSPEA